MEKETSSSVWRGVARVVLIWIVISVFAVMYVWVLIFASTHTREGNLILAIVTGVGLFAAGASVKSINMNFGYTPQHSYTGLMVAPGFVATVLHGTGVMMPTPKEQSFFVFAPGILLVIGIAIWVLRWLIVTAKENKKDQL
jgi:hypothetical protein